MNQPSKKTVYVFGAGFTKAFLPDAPVLVDDYNGDALREKFIHFKYAYDILQSELDRHQGKKIDLERLMSRLDSGMPYDLSLGTSEELRLLLSEIKKSFKDRLEKAKEKYTVAQQLGAFAIYCIETRSTCITFNYDDILDQALYEISEIHHSTNNLKPRWTPDNGYGFFCRHAARNRVESVTNDDMAQPPMRLLKLHGSINWYSKLGYSPPYSIDAIVHYEEWYPSYRVSGQDKENIVPDLETEPFIVPPVLVKSVLVEQPILRRIWSWAYRELRQAEQVVFIGYSLPVTDIAASFLFHEAIQRNTQVSVVNWAPKEKTQQGIRSIYQKIFPQLQDEQ